MKIAHLVAAGLMVAGLGVSTAASAQDYRGHRDTHREYRGGHRSYGHNGYLSTNGYRGYRGGRGYGWNSHRRCTTQWRHHRRVTVCYR